MDLGRLLGETLLRARREAGVTQGEMARMLGLGRPTRPAPPSRARRPTLPLCPARGGSGDAT